MNKLEKFDAFFITKTFFRTPPDRINQGLCFKWAFYSYLMFKDVKIWYNNYHAFVKYKGKFYDAQSPNGERSWLNLKVARGCDCRDKHCYIHPTLHAYPSSIDQFKFDWDSQPRLFKFTWQDVEFRARSELRKQRMK